MNYKDTKYKIIVNNGYDYEIEIFGILQERTFKYIETAQMYAEGFIDGRNFLADSCGDY